MHRAFVSCIFYIDSYDGLFIRSFTSKLNRLAVGLLLVLRWARAFSAVFRFAGKKLAFVPIREAVIPVAGLGTRMLSATNAIPKEFQFMTQRLLSMWSRKLSQLASLKL